MSAARIQSFDEFWPFYVREHSHKTNRVLHFVGTSAAIGSVAAGALLRKPALLLLAPLFGYGMAWIGHFFVQKNRPAAFGHPLWSLQADLVMWTKIALGTMDAEVARVMSTNGVRESNGEAEHTGFEVHTPEGQQTIN
jgi:hypothetical protein